MLVPFPTLLCNPCPARNAYFRIRVPKKSWGRSGDGDDAKYFTWAYPATMYGMSGAVLDGVPGRSSGKTTGTWRDCPAVHQLSPKATVTVRPSHRFDEPRFQDLLTPRPWASPFLRSRPPSVLKQRKKWLVFPFGLSLWLSSPNVENKKTALAVSPVV